MANKFHKISKEQFLSDGGACYDNIILPKRGSSGSAGYDFFLTEDVTFRAGQSIVLQTGIRCELDSNLCLLIYPRSSLGFKYKMTLDNTVGVIDSDYFHAKNEGHIMIKMTNNSAKPVALKQGSGVAQGIITQYFLTDDDNAKDVRTGGFGSTNK